MEVKLPPAECDRRKRRKGPAQKRLARPRVGARRVPAAPGRVTRLPIGDPGAARRERGDQAERARPDEGA